MTSWYYAIGPQQHGPVTDEEMHAFIRERRVARETHVWHSGMDSWKAAAEVEDLNTAFAALPPPLPSPSEAAAVSLENERTADASILAASTLARPWPRFWARFIDLGLFSALLGFGIALALAYFAPELYLGLATIDGRVQGLLLLPVISLILAALMAVLGTTPGKAILGIKVKKLTGSNSFIFHLKREFKVWFAGLALGIPLIALFTQIHQYRRVAAGRPAGYDEGVVSVEGRPSGFRVFAGVLLAVTLVSLGVYSQVMDRETARDLYVTQSWTNPITTKRTEFAKTWTVTEVPINSGRLFHFVSSALFAEALFGFEKINIDGVNNEIYGKAIQAVIKEEVELTSEWIPVVAHGHQALRASGKSTKMPGTSVEVTVAVIGRNAWRTLVFAGGRSVADLPGKETLVEAAFETVE